MTIVVEDGEDDDKHDDALRRQVVVASVPRLAEHVEIVLQGAAAAAPFFIRECHPAAEETQTPRFEIESQYGWFILK